MTAKPPAVRGRPSIAARLDAVLEEYGEAVLRKLVAAAEKGDVRAQVAVLDRVAPARKEPLLRFTMPPMETLEDVGAALDHVVKLAADGAITLSEANALAGLIERRGRVFASLDLDAKMAELQALIDAAKAVTAPMGAPLEGSAS